MSNIKPPLPKKINNNLNNKKNNSNNSSSHNNPHNNSSNNYNNNNNNNNQNETENEIENEQNLKYMTLLGPDSIKWMNKRRPLNQTQIQPQHISPHRASQLKDMFDGLDFNGGGEVDLKEFKEAIAYVESRSKGSSNGIFGDPKKINQIFQEMDADGSGTVDFNEFVTALTSDSKSGTNSGNQLSQLQHTFYEFANMHRRQNILDKIENGVDDTHRYNEFEKLFRVEYFVEGDEEVSLEEKLSKAERDAIIEKKRLKKFYETRNLEISRARAASILFQIEKEEQKKRLSEKKIFPDVINSNELNYETYQKREGLSNRMSIFGLKKQTRVSTVPSTSLDRKYQLEVIQDVKNHRNNHILPPAPLSVKRTWEMKGREFLEVKRDAHGGDSSRSRS